MQSSKDIDPILEVKEETDKFDRKIHESPRIKFMTDFKEDTISAKLLNTHYNKYDIEDIIAEDNNENIVEEKKKPIFEIIDDVDPIKEVIEEEDLICDFNSGKNYLI